MPDMNEIANASRPEKAPAKVAPPQNLTRLSARLLIATSSRSLVASALLGMIMRGSDLRDLKHLRCEKEPAKEGPVETRESDSCAALTALTAKFRCLTR